MAPCHPLRRYLLAFLVASLLLFACKRPQDDDGEHPAAADDSPTVPTESSASKPRDESTDPCRPPAVENVTAEDLVPGRTFDKPVFVAQPPGDSEILYVVERPGRILRVRNRSVLDEPFLDLRDRVGTRHQERGLLGLAFHPTFPDTGRFFLYYTPAGAHRNVVAVFEREPESPAVREVRRLVEVDDPEDNHNGGMLTFGPDGHLYAGMGDGGGAGDRHGSIGNGQDRESLLGSILRLDVDAPERRFAPPDNPFAGDARGDPRIWAWGLRNPWRFSFDSETGDLYIGDVGQNRIEEIDVQPADSDGGENYGWRAYEGDETFDRNLIGRVEHHTSPIETFRHGSQQNPVRNGCSITGGYVYRGDALDGLVSEHAI